MRLLNGRQAMEEAQKGAIIGFYKTPGITVCFAKGEFFFKHRDGLVEHLHPLTLGEDYEYYVIENRQDKFYIIGPNYKRN